MDYHAEATVNNLIRELQSLPGTKPQQIEELRKRCPISPTGHGANKQDFEHGGIQGQIYQNVKTVSDYQARGLGYDTSGVILWNNKRYEFSDDATLKLAWKTIYEEVEKARDDADIEPTQKSTEKNQKIQHAADIKLATTRFNEEMPVMYAKAEEEYWKNHANLLANAAKAEKMFDAANYALRKQMMEEEHQAKMDYMQKYEYKRKEAAKQGFQDITEAEKQQLQERLTLEQLAAQAKF